MKKKFLLLLFLIFGIGWLLYIRFGDLSDILKISKEDGFVEYTTALFYLIGIIVGVYSIFERKRMSAPIGLAVIWTILCFVFLGEETSWFQRILNYSVSSVESVSKQKEFNLHNLNIFNEGGLVKDGKINRLSLTEILWSSQNIFRLGFFGYFLFVPILLFNARIKKLLTRIGYVRPSATMITIMMIVFVFSFVLPILSPAEFKPPIAESREMLYALFILTYVIVDIRPQKELVTSYSL